MSAHLIRSHRLQGEAYAATAAHYAERGLPHDADMADFYRRQAADYARMADELEADVAQEIAA